VRDVEVAALHHRRCGACAAAFALRSFNARSKYDVSLTYIRLKNGIRLPTYGKTLGHDMVWDATKF
jgi:hypothetical protein